MFGDTDTERQVLAALDRFNTLVRSQDWEILSEFADDEDVLLIGSEAGEVAAGPEQLSAFFRRIFDRSVRFSWEWTHRRVSCADGLAWVFADGEVVVSGEEETKRASYRLTGVLEKSGERWLWRLFHGSEPA